MLDALPFQIIAVIGCFIVIVLGIKKRISVKKHMVVLLFCSYMIMLISITFFPMPIQRELIEHLRESNFLNNNYVPLKTVLPFMGDTATKLRPIVGNVILFVPMGLLVPLLYSKMSSFRRVTAVGFLASVMVEFLQLCLSFLTGPYRVTNIDDVILNTIGTIMGFIVFRISIVTREALRGRLFKYTTLLR